MLSKSSEDWLWFFRARVAAFLFLQLLVLCAPNIARAQTSLVPDNGEASTAEALLEEGLKAAEAGRWQDAYRAFSEASKLQSSVNLDINLAIAASYLGRLLEAERRLSDLEKHPNIDEETRNAVSQQLVGVREALPKLRLLRQDLSAQDRVYVDGRLVIEQVISLDPGVHVIAVRRAGAKEWSASVSLREGFANSIRLESPDSTERPLSSNRPPVIATEDEIVSTELDAPSSPILEQWWFWTGVAVVVVAGTTTAVLIASQPENGELGTLDAGLTLSF